MIVMRNIITFGFQPLSPSNGYDCVGCNRMMAAENENPTDAKSIMTSAIIGIAIAVAA